MRYFYALFLLFSPFLFSLPAHAAEDKAEVPSASAPAPVAAHLSAKEKGDLARVEGYLNGLKNVMARFLQVSDSGGLRQGTIMIQRPGKMRVIYDDPDKDFIVADGSHVHIWDDELGNQTSVGVDDSLASFILRDNLSLSGDVVVTRFVRYPTKIEVTLASAKQAEEGDLTLIFEDRPLQLRQWRVADAQGHTTGVNLQNMREDATFPEDAFVFVSPKLGKKR